MPVAVFFCNALNHPWHGARSISASVGKTMGFTTPLLLATLVVESAAVVGDTLGTARPSIGATYMGSIEVPLIGRQQVVVQVTSRSGGHIHLEGILQRSANFRFAIRSEEAFHIVLDDDLQRAMRRWQCRIDHVSFDRQHDAAECTVTVIPIRFRRRISLTRAMA